MEGYEIKEKDYEIKVLIIFSSTLNLFTDYVSL